MRKRPAIFAEMVFHRAVELIFEWAKEQARLREEALRRCSLRGGGVAGVVVFHDPEAIR